MNNFSDIMACGTLAIWKHQNDMGEKINAGRN